VALGVIVGLTNVVSRKAVEAAVRARAPRGTEALNLKALQAGLDYADTLRAEGEKRQA
jgi:2-oxoglutarate ferredoxin oxidoreductase subunit gamma